MADIRPEIVRTNNGEYLISWIDLTESDTAIAAQLPPASGPVTVQVAGTFGESGAVSILASNDGANFVAPVNEYGGTTALAAVNAAGLFPLLAQARYIQPDVSAGTGSSVTVTIRVPARY